MNDPKDLEEIIAPKFLSSCFGDIVSLTQTSNNFPDKDELGYYKRVPSCNQNIKTINSLIGEMIQLTAAFGSENHQIDPTKTIKYTSIIDVLDSYLENADLALDKIKAHVNEDKAMFIKENPTQHQVRERTEARPQDKFTDKVDNSEEYPFVPKITNKPHAKTNLDEKLLLAQFDKVKFFQNVQNPSEYEFVHPYEEEINTLEYQDWQYELDVKTQQPSPLKAENFLFVHDLDTFQTLLTELRSEDIKEIAIDLEHHSYHSYQGFTCLMQLSTRTKDYIIDTLALRDNLHELNEIFTNPQVVKVLHGADMDIQWLQKDFGLYIVNMFDTGQASRFLKFPSISLAYLLKEYCKVIANKEYQTADWRTRPLPKDFIKYAREDTHYLLYIYDELRKKVIVDAKTNNLDPIESLKSVLNKSKMISLKTYKKPVLKNEGYYNIMNRYKPVYSRKKYLILKKVYRWRDTTARLEDESIGFILPMNLVFEITELAPKSTTEVYSKIKKLNHVAKRHIPQLIEDILKVDEEMYSEKAAEQAPIAMISSTKAPLPTVVPKFAAGHTTEIVLSESERYKLADEKVNLVSTKSTEPTNLGHNYHNIFAPKQPSSQSQQKFNELKNSFKYNSLYDFTMSFQPNIKADIVQLQKEYEKTAKQKKAQENLNTQTVNQANLVSAEQGFLEFTKEKGEAPKQADQKPTLRLNLDKLEKKEPALPASLREKYNVRNTKKPRQVTEKDIESEQTKFNEKVKKLKNNMQEANIIKKIENKFDVLQNSDDEDEEEFDEGQILSKTQSKAFKKFWEKNSTIQAGDPLQILHDKERGNKHRPQAQKKFFKKHNSNKKRSQR